MIPAVVTHVRGREALLEQTLASAKEAGVSVERVFQRDDLPPGMRSLYVTAHDAVVFMQQEKWEHGLFLENDVIFSSLYRQHEADLIRECTRIISLYCPDYLWYPMWMDADVKAGRDIPFQIVPGRGATVFWGSQAVFMNREAIDAALYNWPENVSFDIRLRDTIHGNREYFKIAVPNLVQHMGKHATWTKKEDEPEPHNSVTFRP